MPPISSLAYKLPYWLFPQNVYMTIGFFFIIEETEDGMPWRCDLPMSKGIIQMMFWQGQWHIVGGCEYRQDLIDTWTEWMIRFYQ